MTVQAEIMSLKIKLKEKEEALKKAVSKMCRKYFVHMESCSVWILYSPVYTSSDGLAK